MKGYKVFNPDWTCRGFQYKVGKMYRHKGEIDLCESGFHFCERLVDCFNYYKFDPKNKVAEVEAFGYVKTGENKSVTNGIKIIKELSWYEVLNMVNTGSGNSGNRNSGNCNSGNCNSGNCNSGNCNSGDYNSGDYNSGNRNSGNYNSGDYNSGYRNSGDCNGGDWNGGICNSGDCNSGNRNSGNWNSGDWNSGNSNSGDCNSGNRNSGNWNSGDCNSGNRNSGNWNSTEYSSGFFNTIEQPLFIFNKPTSISREEIYDNLTIRAMIRYFILNEWIDEKSMRDEEKKKHPEYETTGGYLKTYEYKEACANMWEKMTEEEREGVWDIPNFDPEIFFEITGIRVESREMK